MSLAGLDQSRLKAILVSHEHRDHIHGVGIVARKLNLPVYINPGTLEKTAAYLGRIEPKSFRTGEIFWIGSIQIHAFSVSHDAVDPAGFTFSVNGRRLGLATDVGTATSLVRESLADCRALILEANHDPDMLMKGPYPWETKRRVRGRHGHLSNEDSAELLAAVSHRDLERVVLAHLSRTNNRPELAVAAAASALNGRPGVILEVADQDRPGEIIEI